MKKLLLLSIAAASSALSYAQVLKVKKVYDQPLTATASKTTTPVIHDTLVMANTTSADTLTNYLYSIAGGPDSGYLAGTSFAGTNGFAERYDFKTSDSSVQVIGILGIFNGHVQSTSTKNLTFKCWSQGPIVASAQPHRFNGFPATVLDSAVVAATSLGLVNDSYFHQKVVYFATPTSYLTDSFFVGYSMPYNFDVTVGGGLGGDTIGLATTRLNARNSPKWFITGTDTMVNVQNASSMSQGFIGWSDMGAVRGLELNYFIFPIVNTKNSLGVNGITKRDFTFYGNYPNPCVNNTNVKFALARTTGVTIQVTDMAGRVVNTIEEASMSAGEHTVTLNTANLPAGQYVYLVRTTEGDGIASQITVAK